MKSSPRLCTVLPDKASSPFFEYNTHPMMTWRLITTNPASGSWNMAVDEAVLEHAGRGDVLPTLRLYAWDPPYIALAM